jgi:hypothetical protein
MLFFAVDPQATEADVDRFDVPSEKLHAGRATKERRPYPPVPPAIRSVSTSVCVFWERLTLVE